MKPARVPLACAALCALLLLGGPASGKPAGGDADVTTQEQGQPGISAEAHYQSAGSAPPPESAPSSSESAATASVPVAPTAADSTSSDEVSSVVTGLPAYSGPASGGNSLAGPHPCVQVKVGSLKTPNCTDSPPNGGRTGGKRPGPGSGGMGRPPPSPEELAAIAADRATAAAPRPRVRIAPSGIGLTGLESYFWLADPLRPITAVARVPGLTVVAEARPVQYVWHFGDGFEAVTTHPGTPWRPGRPGSVAHLYEVRGRYRLVVEAIWEARWRAGQGPWRSLGFFTTTGGRDYPVRQVVSRLVPGF